MKALFLTLFILVSASNVFAAAGNLEKILGTNVVKAFLQNLDDAATQQKAKLSCDKDTPLEMNIDDSGMFILRIKCEASGDEKSTVVVKIEGALLKNLVYIESIAGISE